MPSSFYISFAVAFVVAIVISLASSYFLHRRKEYRQRPVHAMAEAYKWLQCILRTNHPRFVAEVANPNSKLVQVSQMRDPYAQRQALLQVCLDTGIIPADEYKRWQSSNILKEEMVNWSQGASVYEF